VGQYSSMADSRSVTDALVEASHFLAPDALPATIEHFAGRIGARSAVVYLADPEQEWLIPLPRAADDELDAVAVDRTLAGRSFRSVAMLDTVDESGARIVWVPVVDGTERLGVMRFVFEAGETRDTSRLRAFAGAVAELIMTKRSYGDFFEITRRRQPLTIAAELLWQLLPPLTFATRELVIAGVFVPAEDLGGDAFDYGVDLERAQIAVFDGMGHGLGAGLLATTAVAVYRNSRRAQLSLAETVTRIGSTIEAHFGAEKFVTGVVASLDIATGRISWCMAGHPPPLVVRDGRVVKHLDRGTGMPFGVGPASAVFEEQLEPGDRVLLYTDGVTEARDANGELFGIHQLVDLISRTAGDDPPPEAMRRLMHAIEEHNEGPMRDDATVVMLEWQGIGSVALEITDPA
jgi:serine/threonine protein phosphatase PrpC